MKNLSTGTGIGTDPNFLNGDLVDSQTLLNTTILQDIVQFFQKLKSKAGLTENGNFDNEVNGYQTVEALDKRNFVNGSGIFIFNKSNVFLNASSNVSYNYAYDETYSYGRFIGIVSYTRNAINYIYNFDVTSSVSNLVGGLSLTTTDGGAEIKAYSDSINFNNTAPVAVSNILITIQIFGHKA